LSRVNRDRKKNNTRSRKIAGKHEGEGLKYGPLAILAIGRGRRSKKSITRQTQIAKRSSD